MTKFPLNKDDWYKLRDDRTNRVENASLNGIENFKVQVIYNLDEEYFSEKIFLKLTLNILSRWCRNISLFDFNKSLKFEGRKSLKSYVLSIDPYNNFEIIDAYDNSADISLIIGNSIDNYLDLIWINANNWISGIGTGKQQFKVNTSQNIVGISFAACLGNSALYNFFITKKANAISTTWYSLFDYQKSDDIGSLNNPKIKETLNLGNLLQVGCGAVGSSLAYLLTTFKWQGSICFVDFDKVKIPNCSSSLLFSAEDSIDKTIKVECCRNIISENLVSIFNGDYSSFINANGKSNFDLILCLANERNIWNTIQNNYPPVVLHATTNESWGVNIGRHIPLKEWCIMCRFKDSVKYEMQAPCGDSIVSKTKDGEEILGTLPFLSPASATLLLSELIRLSQGYVLPSNFTIFSLKLNGHNIFQNLKQISDKNCPVCNSQFEQIYHKQNQNTKYWGYSK